VFYILFAVWYNANLFQKGGNMPRRKDKEPSTMVSSGIRMPAQLMDDLNRTADTKGISRSALIVQILTKATKAKTTKSREDER
jgi:hypothetical protein